MVSKNASPLEIDKEEFKRIGYKLIDSVSEYLDNIYAARVTPGETPGEVQKILGESSFPEAGIPVQEILSRATSLLFSHSLFNGHPKFMGYITGSPAPVGALGDFLAAVINPNVGASILSPVATEIEKQTIRWLAELVGVSPVYGGLLVSGGNMANFTAFLAARTVKAPGNIKEDGISNSNKKLTVYCSVTTHIWIEKAAVLFGLGSRAVRWIETDSENKIDNKALEQAINNDIRDGCNPFMVVGTAGDVSTGVVDNLEGLASICKKYNLWFHVDGAYGLPAVIIPRLKHLFKGIEEADSIALDPHKWLYSPLEAGCTLVRDPGHLLQTFSFHPAYYNFDNQGAVNYYEYGLQNSRGFRALKVWLTLQQAGRKGFEKMISRNIRLSEMLFEKAKNHPELEPVTQSLSITTFRYVPTELLDKSVGNEVVINNLNETLLNKLQQGGELFLSNAVLKGKYCLRTCIVNFRTSEKDIDDIIEIIVREGRKVYKTFVEKVNQ